ncbi:uncharacterized protein LOC123206713 [Mangifera indica]|uniref:uncharacterized protein LOC123206713 n=1 Tax=Mangifera indica TaxID=29780 RepID=UPI001CFA75A4|nr:uncharacterized protein LOC123206713 [Mangifera indica]XP_044479856.1 uncharacterized protein LOC123206713 [Mangifera indica]
MDETEFRRLLDLFPVVRSRDYQAELDTSRQLISFSAQDEKLNEWQDAWDEEDKKQMESQGAFWQKLKLAAGRKVSAADAEKFCQAFEQLHKKLVYGLNLDAARSFINSSKSLEE